MDISVAIDKGEYHKQILKIGSMISGLDLTDGEISLLVCLIINDCNIVNQDSKELLRHKLDKNKFDINMYVKKLKDKGVLIPLEGHKGQYRVAQNIVTLLEQDEVSFKFISQ